MIWDRLRKMNQYELAENVRGFKSLNVNFYIIGEPGAGNPWTIIDTGISGSGKKIIKEAASLFGKDNPPKAVLLTHGHFDHVGGIPDLLKVWPDLKVYAHPMELPYLTGTSNFPPPETVDASVAMAYLLQLYSGKHLNLKDHVLPLPDAWVPGLEEWRYIHTPGVSPGHVSFFRPKDNLLIAGDLISSRKQKNALLDWGSSTLEIQGPPAHYAINKSRICSSLIKIHALNPVTAGVGQGPPVSESILQNGLSRLINLFEIEKIKEEHLYTTYNTSQPPAVDKEPVFNRITKAASFVSLLAVGAGLGYYLGRRK